MKIHTLRYLACALLILAPLLVSADTNTIRYWQLWYDAYFLDKNSMPVMVVQGTEPKYLLHSCTVNSDTVCLKEAMTPRRPSEAATVKIELWTKDGTKWHAVWVRDPKRP